MNQEVFQWGVFSQRPIGQNHCLPTSGHTLMVSTGWTPSLGVGTLGGAFDTNTVWVRQAPPASTVNTVLSDDCFLSGGEENWQWGCNFVIPLMVRKPPHTPKQHYVHFATYILQIRVCPEHVFFWACFVWNHAVVSCLQWKEPAASFVCPEVAPVQVHFAPDGNTIYLFIDATTSHGLPPEQSANCPLQLFPLQPERVSCTGGSDCHIVNPQIIPPNQQLPPGVLSENNIPQGALELGLFYPCHAGPKPARFASKGILF